MSRGLVRLALEACECEEGLADEKRSFRGQVDENDLLNVQSYCTMRISLSLCDASGRFTC